MFIMNVLTYKLILDISMSLYHPIYPKYFKEFDHILHHTHIGMNFTCKSHGDIAYNSE